MSVNRSRHIIFIFFIVLSVLSGCTLEDFGKQELASDQIMREPFPEVSSPVIAHRAGQNDFSLPFYPASIQKQGWRCTSSMPDGRSGYISRADFISMHTIDEIAEFYRRKKFFIKDISVENTRKVIVSDNSSMTVYPGKGQKSASTIVFYRNNEISRTQLIFTGFVLYSSKK